MIEKNVTAVISVTKIGEDSIVGIPVYNAIKTADGDCLACAVEIEGMIITVVINAYKVATQYFKTK